MTTHEYLMWQLSDRKLYGCTIDDITDIVAEIMDEFHSIKINRMTTIEQAEQIVGRKLRKNEKFIVEQFGNNDKYRIDKDDKGSICAHLKDEHRSR